MSEPMTPEKALDNLNEAWRACAYQGTLGGAKKMIAVCEESVAVLRALVTPAE